VNKINQYLKILLPLFLLSGIQMAQAQMTEIRENAESSQKDLSEETGEAKSPSTPPALSEPEDTEDASNITETKDSNTPPAEAHSEPPPAKPTQSRTRVPQQKSVTLLPPKPQAPEPESQRSKWYIGFSVGPGFGQVGVGDGDQVTHKKFLGLSKDRSVASPSMEFEVGGTINHQLLLGVHWGFGATGADKTESKPARTVSQSQLLAMLTFFPMLDGQGLFLRTGLGFSSLEDITSQTEEDEIKLTYSGFGSCVGVGYAFWLGETFNLTVHSNVHFGLFDGDKSADEPTSGWYGNLMLGFMWY
jgi:hypothetical protein